MINLQTFDISSEIKGSLRRIMIWPGDVKALHTSCGKVIDFNEELHQEIADMFAILEMSFDGIALAANQVGILKRLFVASFPYGVEQNSIGSTATSEYDTELYHIVFINPEIIEKDKFYNYEEGCLSIPGYYENRIRFGRIVLKYQDSLARYHTKEFWGLNAFVIQHEIDHLDGNLFIDGYSKLKLNKVKRKIKKFRKKTSFAD